jgi:uncharacterized protein YecT (DUF1311 family)
VTIALLAGRPADATAAQTPIEQQIAHAWQRCEADTEYRVGGAAHGDCLLAASDQREGAIEGRLAHLREDECPDLATAIDEAQRQWLAYREALCGLYANTFDSTPFYLRAAECQLRLTIRREHEFDMFDRTRPTSRATCE